ncbi:DUF72 domain-containing protein [Candidatus Poribacteria bacterium]|nr:DUF72 domain-containing protein [Candidatus Poribacteria bacterium]
MTSQVLIGTSGHYYDDWHGVFYPPHLAKNQRLDYYASVFRALEINATYYGTPSPESSKRMVREAKGRLVFTVKAPGDVTHRGRTGPETVVPFLKYLEPFRESAVLSAVLMQFPGALHNTPESRALLARAAAALGGIQLAVELRHASWDTEQADAFLGTLGASRAAIDQPELRGLSARGRCAMTGPVAYFRFHGRNAAAWYAKREEGGSKSMSVSMSMGGRGKGDERYRYRYSDDELRPWVPLVREGVGRAQSTLVFFNNHPEGNAVLDAFTFAEMLGAPLARPDSGDMFG